MPTEIEAKSEDIHAILQAVNTAKPTRKALADYRQWLADNPKAWHVAGDMAEIAEQKMLDTLNGPAVIKESARVGLAAIRNELGYASAPMLEQLLIEQVALCWLQMYLTQYQYSGIMGGSVTLNQGDYWERRLTSTQTRYLRALETLARVRRLSRVTPLQVNIGGQQVNVAEVQGER